MMILDYLTTFTVKTNAIFGVFRQNCKPESLNHQKTMIGLKNMAVFMLTKIWKKCSPREIIIVNPRGQKMSAILASTIKY